MADDNTSEGIPTSEVDNLTSEKEKTKQGLKAKQEKPLSLAADP